MARHTIPIFITTLGSSRIYSSLLLYLLLPVVVPLGLIGGRAAARGHFPKAFFRPNDITPTFNFSLFRPAGVSCYSAAHGPLKKGGHRARLGATARNGTILRQRIRFG